jgi:hypothetical protein
MIIFLFVIIILLLFIENKMKENIENCDHRSNLYLNVYETDNDNYLKYNKISNPNPNAYEDLDPTKYYLDKFYINESELTKGRCIYHNIYGLTTNDKGFDKEHMIIINGVPVKKCCQSNSRIHYNRNGNRKYECKDNRNIYTDAKEISEPEQSGYTESYSLLNTDFMCCPTNTIFRDGRCIGDGFYGGLFEKSYDPKNVRYDGFCPGKVEINSEGSLSYIDVDYGILTRTGNYKDVGFVKRCPVGQYPIIDPTLLTLDNSKSYTSADNNYASYHAFSTIKLSSNKSARKNGLLTCSGTNPNTNTNTCNTLSDGKRLPFMTNQYNIKCTDTNSIISDNNTELQGVDFTLNNEQVANNETTTSKYFNLSENEYKL